MSKEATRDRIRRAWENLKQRAPEYYDVICKNAPEYSRRLSDALAPKTSSGANVTKWFQESTATQKVLFVLGLVLLLLLLITLFRRSRNQSTPVDWLTQTKATWFSQ